MTNYATWDDFQRNFLQCSEAQRYRLQSDLAQLIQGLEAQGLPVPARARQLNTELYAEAIEAQFDNVPI